MSFAWTGNKLRFPTAGPGHCQSFSPLNFLCQPFIDQVYTPNIPDIYFSASNIAPFISGGNLTTHQEVRGTTIIFSIPPRSPERNCSGTVTTLQYCYEATTNFLRNSQARNIFNFATLNKNGSRFTVNETFRATTIPRDSGCADSSRGM